MLGTAFAIHNPENVLLVFGDFMPGWRHEVPIMGSGSVSIWHNEKE